VQNLTISGKFMVIKFRWKNTLKPGLNKMPWNEDEGNTSFKIAETEKTNYAKIEEHPQGRYNLINILEQTMT
jgi:hypothetical protein